MRFCRGESGDSAGWDEGEEGPALPIEVTIDKEKGLITRTLTGQIPIGDMVAELQKTAQHPDYHPAMNSLTDARGFVAPVLESGEMRRLAEYLLAHAADRKGRRAAIVVSRTVDYGMARMLQALADTPSFSIGVFYDVDEAKRWLE